MEKKPMTSSTKGLIISLALIVFSVLTIILKQDQNKSLSIIPIAITVGGLTWAVIDYAKSMNGNITFGNGFSHGFKATALIAAIMGFWFVLSMTLIFPEALERGFEIARKQMAEGGKMSDSDIDKNMEMARKIALPMGTIVTVIFYLAIGAIGSLIGAAVAKKNPNPVFPDQLGN